MWCPPHPLEIQSASMDMLALADAVILAMSSDVIWPMVLPYALASNDPPLPREEFAGVSNPGSQLCALDVSVVFVVPVTVGSVEYVPGTRE